MKKIKKILSLIIAIFSFSSIYSLEFSDFFKTCTIEQIKTEIKQNPDFINLRTNKNSDTILMEALKANCSYEIIKFLVDSGCSISTKNIFDQDSVTYSVKYSTDEKTITFILKKYGNPQEIQNKIFHFDQTETFLFELAEKNPAAMKALEPYFPKNFYQQKEKIKLQKQKELKQKKAKKEKEIQEQKEAQKTEEKTEVQKEDLKSVQKEEIKPEEKKEEKPEIKKEEPLVQQKHLSLPPIKKYEPVFLYDFIQEPAKNAPSDEEEEFATISNPDQKDKNGCTQLMKAAKTGSLWLVKSLIKSGANVNLCDNEGYTALMYALRYQNSTEVVDYLVQNGARLNDKNDFGTSTLALTSMWSENPEILEKVLKSYSPGDKEIFKCFILTIISENTSLISQSQKINIFIKNNIQVNRFYEGKTPLMYAALHSKSTEILKILIQNGALTTVKTVDGKTAFDFAKENKNLEHDEIFWSLNKGR